MHTLHVFRRAYSIKRSSSLGNISFICSSDRLSRETSGTVPSVWLGCAARASLQTQRHQADVLCSCPAPTSSTSHVWKPLKPLVSRADHPVPYADLCTIKNISKEVRLLRWSKNHLLWNQNSSNPKESVWISTCIICCLSQQQAVLPLCSSNAPYSFVRAQTVTLILFISLTWQETKWTYPKKCLTSINSPVRNYSGHSDGSWWSHFQSICYFYLQTQKHQNIYRNSEIVKKKQKQNYIH